MAKPHLPVSIVVAAIENRITPLHHQPMFNLSSQIHGLKNVYCIFLEDLDSNVIKQSIEKKPRVKLICQTLDLGCPHLKFADILLDRASLFRRCQKFVWVGRHLPGVAAERLLMELSPSEVGTAILPPRSPMEGCSFHTHRGQLQL